MIVRLSALLLGEYANICIQKNKEYDLEKIAELLWNKKSICKKTALYSI